MKNNIPKLVVSLEANDIIYLKHQRRYVMLLEWEDDAYIEEDGSEAGVYDLWTIVELNSGDEVEEIWLHSENQNGNVIEYYSGCIAENFLL